MVISRTASKTAAKKAAAPVRKAAPTPAKAAPTRRTSAPATDKPITTKPADTRPPTKPKAAVKVTGHDVARAALALQTAQKAYETILATYWAQNDVDLQGAVEHAEKAVAEVTPAPRTGRKPNETPTSKTRSKAPVIDEFYDRDKVADLPLRELRDLASDLVDKGLIEEPTKKILIMKQMEAAGLFRSEGDSDSDEDDTVDNDEDTSSDAEVEDYEDEDDETEGDDESDEDSDDEESEDDRFSLDDLKAMKLSALQELAEQNNIDWDDLSKTELVVALWGDDDEEDEDEDDPEDEESEDDEDDEEGEEETLEIDLAELPDMDVDYLYELAKKIGAKVPVSKRKNKDFLVTKITEILTPEDEEEDE